MSEDPILDGQPISTLKVVDLRAKLDRFGLPKSGVKKDLFERLRDYLNSHADGNAQKAPEGVVEEVQEAPARASTSPQKSPNKASSPVKSPVMNKYVAQYLQNQQATLESAKRNAESLQSVPEDAIEQLPDSTPVESDKQESPEVVVPDTEKMVHTTESNETSSTVSNAGSETAPQRATDDTSIHEEKQPYLTKDKAASGSQKEMAAKVEEPKAETSPKKEIVKKIESSEDPAVELDYEEEPEHSNEDKKPVKESPSSKPSESTRKHRPIVFDLHDKPSKSSGSSDVPTSTKTSVSIQPTIKAKTPEEPPEHGVNSLGNIRTHPLSPPRHEVSQYVHITRLKRPFVFTKLQAVLRTFGEFEDEDFWIDSLKSNCIVKYKTVEEAQKARDEMHNVKWPDAPDAPTIHADFTTEEVMTRRMLESGGHKRSSDNSGERSGFIIRVLNDRKDSADHDKSEEKNSEKSDETRKRKASPPAENVKSLEELFCRTKAKPQIYYLPLNDEQVEAKKRSKAEKQ